MPRKIKLPDIDKFVQMYIDGMSEQALAQLAGVSRMTMRHNLLTAAIIPRNRSQAMYVRMQHTSEAERANLTSAAHSAVRGKQRDITELIQRALTRQQTLQYATPIEFAFGDMLIQHGLRVIYQRAIERYNIDIAIETPPIAIEIEFNRTLPFVSRPANHHRRSEYLLDLGWNLCYILICKSWPLTVGAADYIVAWTQQLCTNDTIRGQYSVIRGNGKPVPILRA